MKILILDHSVLSYKSFLRLFTQDYEGETQDEIHEFTRQYMSEIVYLQELHKPDGILWVLDCPRDRIWRHSVVRRYYGPKVNAHPTEWMPGTENRTPENACRWNVECDNTFKTVWLDAAGNFKSKQLTKSKFAEWAKEQPAPPETVDRNGYTHAGKAIKVTSKKYIKRMLPYVAKMYKGNREGAHWPQSAVMDKERFKKFSNKLAYEAAAIFGGRVCCADELEADDLAYAAVSRWWKHDITVVTTDRDWLQLQMHQQLPVKNGTMNTEDRRAEAGTFKFWEPTKYEFLDTDNEKVQRGYLRKILCGDASDNIASARLQGKMTGVGPKACDKIFDEVPLYRMYHWLLEHGDTDTLMRNSTLINLAKLPDDLKERASIALRKSDVVLEKDHELLELMSEASYNMAVVQGQKDRQKQLLLSKSKEGNDETEDTQSTTNHDG